MRVTTGYVVFFADLKNVIDRFGDHRMLIVARMAELLTQIAFADQYDADAGNFFQNARQVVDGAGFFALDDDENFTVRRQRPDVGALVILLLRQSPVARGTRRRVAADAGRIE